MKFLFAQPAKKRFSWELKTAIKSLVDLGVKAEDIVLLFAQEDDTVIEEFQDYDVHVYLDERYDKSYIPSIKPFLWWKYLEENIERENETYVYLDSDTVVLDLSAFELRPTKSRWYCSNTVGYLGYRYIQSVTNAEKVFEIMTDAIKVPIEWIESIEKQSGGAQWVVKNPKAGYWHDVYVNSIVLYKAIEPLDTSLQKWTAEMWAQLWTMYHYGIDPKVSNKLDFAWSTDNTLGNEKIIHNAGVTEGMKLFFKGKYEEIPPLKDLEQNSGKVSDLYVNFVKKANYEEK
ncbi:hypothetical protein [Lactococcus formosensis]|uniref:Prophage pi2 protein 34 n=1 Tax=Lactococcus formosensis TaxID=1281486 RepID=A0A9X4NY60_9LACT|nr:hypothetical protein [Lactococcus formosensis]MDG6126449.1 hypothetical protein [Lactococcus formosensis]MDG6131863.1 hypothetical protein [Lactococcus formosensis]MDG6133860.1 hypothetical protein [Lactococcus formosensis]MDG6140514.1 hypothetical protein [Lactococcus formosensis]MDG6145056.1 hypothetical protein [Lactococcus formosensis]